MSDHNKTPARPLSLQTLALVAVLAGLVGGVGGAALVGSGLIPLGGAHGAGDQAIHDYILANPDILPQAMDVLRQREAEAQIGQARQMVEAPFPGAVLGNPAGHKVLVEFMDYACGYCRKSEEDVAHLIAADPDLKVVVRQLPILSPESRVAAAMALAAAEQGKFAAFHHAMFAAGHPDEASIAAAAKTAGLDLERARKVAASTPVKTEIAGNLDLTNQLGIRSTPTWLAGGHLLLGAVGEAELRRNLDTPMSAGAAGAPAAPASGPA
jgi:protein-disulfide isomerase